MFKFNDSEPRVFLISPLVCSQDPKLRDGNGFMEVAAYGIAQLVDLDSLRNEFGKDPAYRHVPLPADLNPEVLLISANPKSSADSPVPRDAFIFR